MGSSPLCNSLSQTCSILGRKYSVVGEKSIDCFQGNIKSCRISILDTSRMLSIVAIVHFQSYCQGT